jgi:hypothetical protein
VTCPPSGPLVERAGGRPDRFRTHVAPWSTVHVEDELLKVFFPEILEQEPHLQNLLSEYDTFAQQKKEGLLMKHGTFNAIHFQGKMSIRMIAARPHDPVTGRVDWQAPPMYEEFAAGGLANGLFSGPRSPCSSQLFQDFVLRMKEVQGASEAASRINWPPVDRGGDDLTDLIFRHVVEPMEDQNRHSNAVQAETLTLIKQLMMRNFPHQASYNQEQLQEPTNASPAQPTEPPVAQTLVRARIDGSFKRQRTAGGNINKGARYPLIPPTSFEQAWSLYFVPMGPQQPSYRELEIMARQLKKENPKGHTVPQWREDTEFAFTTSKDETKSGVWKKKTVRSEYWSSKLPMWQYFEFLIAPSGMNMSLAQAEVTAWERCTDCLTTSNGGGWSTQKFVAHLKKELPKLTEPYRWKPKRSECFGNAEPTPLLH